MSTLTVMLLRWIPLLFLFPALLAHDGDHGLHHWETASPDPDRIFLSFHGDPANSRGVAWRTDASVSQGYVQWARALPEPRFDHDPVTVAATTEAVDINASPFNTQGVVHFHSVVIGGLEPDTLYAYRVGDGAQHWSEWFQFRTARDEPAPFSFVYFGDAQNDVLSHWSRVIRMAFQTAPDAAFALHAGDLINRAHRDVEWGEWFKAGGWLHARWTGVPLPGNHEYARLGDASEQGDRIVSLLWRPQFTLPVERSLPVELHETVYTVEYQGVQVIALDSNRQVEAQTPWLRRQLQKAGPTWRVVSFHHPIFSPGGNRDNQRLRDAWKPLLDELGVDLVLQGHDHTYARGHVPFRNADDYAEGTFNTMYVTSVSGPKMYDITKGKFARYAEDGLVPVRQAENTQFFQVIEIDGGEMTYTAYTATGEVYDRAVIRKSADGSKRIINELPATPENSFENTRAYDREPTRFELP